MTKIIDLHLGENTIKLNPIFGERALLFVDKIDFITLVKDELRFSVNGIEELLCVKCKDEETAKERMTSLGEYIMKENK